MITKAKSGHPGIVLGAAPIVHTLFTRHININAQDDKWYNRDRFILSAGHGSTLLYMMLHLSGVSLTMDDLKNLRQKDSMTPGHPEYRHTKGVEISTGPLGQGIASAVGFAIAESYLAAKFNQPGLNVIDNNTFVLCGDGDLQEGIAMEAMSLAGHLGLNKLIILHDSNDIQLDGEVSFATSDNLKAKFEAMGFNYIKVEDGNDIDSVDEAISTAKNSSDKPTFIEIKTIIGYGAPNSGESSIHGKPMSQDDIKELRKNLEYNYPELEFANEVKEFYKKNVTERGISACNEWNHLLRTYEKKYPEEYAELMKFVYDDFEIDSVDDIPTWKVGEAESTRKEMGKILDWLSTKLPNIMGGSADLTASTMVKGADGIYGKDNPLGRNIKFGVREHAMGAITNGLSLCGYRPYCSTFLSFSDYLKPSLRMAALMQLPNIYIFTHDSISVGEDGPTHQPVEQLSSLRSLPNFEVFRPADANEVIGSYRAILDKSNNPSAIVLSRNKLPILECTKAAEVEKGGYVVLDSQRKPDGIVISCGEELHMVLDAANALKTKGIELRVVSMPNINRFLIQDEAYIEGILPVGIKKIAVEASDPLPWQQLIYNSKYLITMNQFGVSGNYKDIYKKYGFDSESLAAKIEELIK